MQMPPLKKTQFSTALWYPEKKLRSRDMLKSCYLLTPRGPCIGVKRALNIASQILKLYKSVYIIEDLIHNKTAIEYLLSQGVIKVQNIEEIPDASTIMFSTHGVSPALLKRAEEKELVIIDTTCPVVKQLQERVAARAQAGDNIVIIGNRAHQEVVSLLGYAGNGAYVVENEGEVDMLSHLRDAKISVFTQTSHVPEDVQSVVRAINEKFGDVVPDFKHNICDETLQRQAVIKDVAPKVEALIVIGSAYSSNTMSLIRTGELSGIARVVRFDSKDDMQDEIIEGLEAIALTSAVSAAAATVDGVVTHLRDDLGFEMKEFPNTDDAAS